MTKGKIITEAEGLQILKSFGLSNGEEVTKYYIKNKCINTGAALNAYLEKLEQIYTYARLVINEKKNKPYAGTKRLIELGELRDNILERYDGRINNGRQPTEDEIILDQYIFNRLLELNERKSFPHKTWANKIGLLDTSKLNKKEFNGQLTTVINNLHITTLGHNIEITSKIIEDFKAMIYKRNKDIIEKGFNRLEAQGKIQITIGYRVRTTKDEYESITEEKFNQLEQDEKGILETFDMESDTYISMKKYPSRRNDNYFIVFNEIAEHMKSVHGIKYYFKSRAVTLLDREQYEDIDVYDMKATYKKKLLELTESRVERKDYKDTGELQKEWYAINTFTLMKEMGIDIPKDKYKKEILKLKIDNSSNVIKDKILLDSIIDGCSIFDDE